jgi:hypothetical protein
VVFRSFEDGVCCIIIRLNQWPILKNYLFGIMPLLQRAAIQQPQFSHYGFNGLEPEPGLFGH